MNKFVAIELSSNIQSFPLALGGKSPKFCSDALSPVPVELCDFGQTSSFSETQFLQS